jgi:hypothetical protein
MQVFGPSYTIIDGIRPKVIETAKGLLLNTQYYHKDFISPIPFESYSAIGSVYSLNTSRNAYLNGYSWNRCDNTLGIIQDNKNQDRYYFKIQNGYVHGTRQEFLVCVEERNNQIIPIANTNVGDMQIMEYVDQDDNYMYFFIKSNTTSYLYTYNKVTFAFSNVLTLGNSTYSYRTMTKVHVNETFIYFFTQEGMNFRFYQYNKNTGAVYYSKAMYRGASTNTGNYNYTTFSDDVVDLGNGKYGVYAYNCGNPSEPIDLYILDTTVPFTANELDTMISMKHVAIAWGNGHSEIPFLTNATSIKTYYRFSVLKVNDSTRYLNVYVYNENYENVAYLNVQGIYTFLINSDTSIHFTGFTSVDSAKLFGAVLESENKRHLIVAKYQSFQILKFNEQAKKYENAGLEITSCYSAGFDELMRIWYERTDGSVEIINLEDAQSVKIKFEKDYYEYTGSIIGTYIEFSALNYLNEEMNGTFKLTLSGSAVFIENNSNELTFTYQGGGVQQIGININGINPVTVYPKYIK